MEYPRLVHLAIVPALAAFAVLFLSQSANPAYAADKSPAAWPADKPFPKLTVVERTTEPLLKADKPWEDFCVNYARVQRVGKTWRMWYNSYDHTYKTDADVFLCYAVSDDGVRWTKPNLGLVDYAGNKNNNIIARGICVPGVFIDASAPPKERFKIVYIQNTHSWQSYGGVSPDGIHWKWTGLLQADNSDTDGVCFRDGDIYRLYLRMWSEGVFKGKRQVGYTESKTFSSFPSPKVILEAGKEDPAGMDFYNSAATKLMPGLYVMFPAAFYRDTQLVIPHAALSRDGVSFERIGRTPFLELGRGFDSRSIYVSPGIPADKPGEYWFYYLGSNTPHDANGPDKVRFGNGIGRFKLRLDVR